MIILWMFVGIYSILVICRAYHMVREKLDGRKENHEAVMKRFCNLYGLTDRESEIVRAIYEGKRITQIADDLGLSENTIRVHSSRMYKKLDVEDRVQAANKIREEMQRS